MDLSSDFWPASCTFLIASSRSEESGTAFEKERRSQREKERRSQREKERRSQYFYQATSYEPSCHTLWNMNLAQRTYSTAQRERYEQHAVISGAMGAGVTFKQVLRHIHNTFFTCDQRVLSRTSETAVTAVAVSHAARVASSAEREAITLAFAAAAAILGDILSLFAALRVPC